MDSFSRLLGSTVNDLECFGRKTKIDRYFKFSIFRLAPKTEKLNHATDCNIVREAKLSLSFIFLFTVYRIKETKPCHRLQHCQRSKIVTHFVFLFTVQRIKVKISVMFQYSTRRKKIKIFLS